MIFLQRFRWSLLFALIILAPFHAFLITWLKSTLDPAGGLLLFISMWREILVAAIILIAAAEFFKKKHPLLVTRYPLLFDALDWLILSYALLALLWLPFQWNEKTQWLLGVRFDVMPFIFLMAVRHVAWPSSSECRMKHMRPKITGILRAFFITGVVVLVFGLLHAIFLPQNFLTHFGYSENQGQFEPGIVISSCQYLEHTDRVCRATSTFGGPTRYGTYVLLMIGLLIGMIGVKGEQDEIKMRRNRIIFVVFGFLVLANAILTYSRSIWMAIVAMAVFAFFWFVPRQKIIKIIIAGLVAAIAAVFLWQLFAYVQHQPQWSPPPFVKTIFVRETSSGEHAKLFMDGLRVVKEHPLGIGLGKVGPASVRFEKFLTENWYVQIADEMGIFGLLLFLGILFLLGKKLLADRWNILNTGLFMALLGIAIAGLFTHSFEETSTMLILAAFVGIQLPISSLHA